ncbi:MAG: hypothetical protein QOE88_2169 [Verrucomicrobiota bacterium]|nr:hypothetical protein [Verrucomicrobiota bacterium]
MKIEVGSDKAELVGNAAKVTGTLDCSVEAISNRVGKVFAITSSGGCDRMGRRVSAEKSEGMASGWGLADSPRLDSTASVE